MKLKLIFALAACLVASPVFSTLHAETITVDQKIKEKASKEARKEAKTLKKEGWKVSPGGLPLDKQLDNAWAKQYATNDKGQILYVMGEGRSIGGNYDAAKTQALTIARQNLAGNIESQVTQLLEASVANENVSNDQSSSLSKVLSESKTLISQKLGTMQPVMECYRQLENGNYEVMVRLAYSRKDALDLAKQSMVENLGADQEALKARINGLE